MVLIYIIQKWIDFKITTLNGEKADLKFFSNKTLLEVGCGHADIGIMFKNIGCDVTASDARIEHLEIAKIKYPNLKYQVFDCDKDLLNKKYDIILHWGVLYHINNVDENLRNVCKNCDYLLLESEVCNDDSINILKVDERDFYDQAYNKIGSRPSEKYI